MTNARFDRYVAPARARPQLWRLVGGVVLIGAAYLLGVMAVFAGAGFALGPERAQRLAASLAAPDTPAAVLLLLATFPGAALGAFLAVRLLHRRAPATLFGPAAAVRRDFAGAVAITLALAVAYLAAWGLAFDPVPNRPFASWLGWLPLLLVGLLIQTGTEELIFRGYLQQQLAARFRAPLIWMVLPSLGFAVLHFDPSQPAFVNAYAIAATALFGILAADLTRRTGNIGAAWGLHFVNNLLAVGILALDGSITGLALHVTPYDLAGIAEHPLLLLADMLATLVAWAVLCRLLGR